MKREPGLQFWQDEPQPHKVQAHRAGLAQIGPWPGRGRLDASLGGFSRTGGHLLVSFLSHLPAMYVRRRSFTRLCLLAVLLLLPQSSLAQATLALPEAVEANVQARLATGDYPGLVVGLIDPSGTQVYGYGSLSAQQPQTPDAATVYEIGSVTKVFTALLLADAAERGVVGLDDPVAQYLPGDVQMPGGEAITLAHLADHTSGLPRLPANLQPADMANPYADYTTDQLYAFLSSYTLPREPGASYEYSNLGMGLLGHVLAQQAGMSYEALVAERIGVPLGLEATAITLSDEAQSRLAPGHNGGRMVPNWDLPTLAGAGAIRSTAADMLRFLGLYMALQETPLASAMDQTTVPRAEASLMDGDSLTIALGWHIRATESRRLVWHNGGTGGYRSFIGFDPVAQRGVVVLTNTTDGADDIGFHLLDPAIPLETPRPTVAVEAETLASYVGTYQIAPAFAIVITEENGRLYGQATNQPIFALYPSNSTRFFLKAANAEVEFTIDEAGAVTGLTLFQGGQEIPGEKTE